MSAARNPETGGKSPSNSKDVAPPSSEDAAPPKRRANSFSVLNIKKLARELEREIQKREKQLALPEQNLEIGTRHLMWMCRQIYSGWVPEALAPIWVGYVQGVLRVGGGPNVKEMAAMIREAREEVEANEKGANPA